MNSVPPRPKAKPTAPPPTSAVLPLIVVFRTSTTGSSSVSPSELV